MNKEEFIDKLHDEQGITKTKSREVVDIMIEGLTSVFNNHEELKLIGLGTFGIRKRAKRTGRNPITKEAVEISASTSPYFKPSSKFREKV